MSRNSLLNFFGILTRNRLPHTYILNQISANESTLYAMDKMISFGKMFACEGVKNIWLFQKDLSGVKHIEREILQDRHVLRDKISRYNCGKPENNDIVVLSNTRNVGEYRYKDFRIVEIDSDDCKNYMENGYEIIGSYGEIKHFFDYEHCI